MQPGGEWNPVWPLGRLSGFSTASTSSSAVNGLHVGQEQRHDNYWQALEQQQRQLRIHGGTFSSSSGSIDTSQLPRTLTDLAGSSQQLCEENPSRVHGRGENMQKTLQQTNLQFDMQPAHQMSQPSPLTHQHSKLNMVGSSGRDQDMLRNNLKMQEFISGQAASQPQIPVVNRLSESFSPAHAQREQGTTSFNERNFAKFPPAMIGQSASANSEMPRQLLHSKTSVQNIATNQLEMSKMQALLSWAEEHNVDISDPAYKNLLAQILPNWQYNRVTAMQKQDELATTVHQLSGLQSTKQSLTSATGQNENTAISYSTSDYSGQLGVTSDLHMVQRFNRDTTIINLNDLLMRPQSMGMQDDRGVGHSTIEYSGQLGVASVLQMVPYGSAFNQEDTAIKNRNALLMQQQSKEMQDNRGVGHSTSDYSGHLGVASGHQMVPYGSAFNQGDTAIRNRNALLMQRQSEEMQNHRGVGHSTSDHYGQLDCASVHQMVPYGSAFNQGDTVTISRNALLMQLQSKEMQDDREVGHSLATSKDMKVMGLPSSSASMHHKLEHSDARNNFDGNQMPHMQYFRSTYSNHPIHYNSSLSSQDLLQVDHQQQAQHIGFTKQQLYVLKAQILAFRRLKLGESIPFEVLHIIVDPPNSFLPQQSLARQGIVNQEQVSISKPEEQSRLAEISNWIYQSASSIKDQNLLKGESIIGEGRIVMPSQTREIRRYHETNINDDYRNDKGKSTWVVTPAGQAVGTSEVKKLAISNSAAGYKDDPTKRYSDPFFYLASSAEEHNSLGSATTNYSRSCSLAYDGKDLLSEESKIVLNRKRAEISKHFDKLLLGNLEMKMIRPDLKKLQIGEKKGEPLYLQSCLKNVVEHQQQEIINIPGSPYQKFVRQCQRQRVESQRQVQQSKVFKEKNLKSIFRRRKNLLETHLAIRDARTMKNKGVAKYHERMLKELTKKNKETNKRMHSLKNNNADRYHMLPNQQTDMPDEESERCKFLSSFLHQTEEYLHQLGEKISAARNEKKAAKDAVAAACAQGVSEESKGAAASAGQEVIVRNDLEDNASANKYYNLAHAVTERVVQQPSMLRAGTLRDYQLVGLQWMLSLYNNKINGILADEMGLGKTVQVMALIAYLMEFKGNYGPHLIIVPNAVLFNWKSELLKWMPSLSCIFYVGAKDQRSKLFMQEVSAVNFNVLVTTYEYVMNDRSKLSKIYWKYIIIDEAQRMKDRESILSRDLDKYKSQRRLLLSGTPLQNDLKELWSLLNLLLPEIFDNQREFKDWFSRVFRRDGPSHNPAEDDQLETEKKVAIIHRLHQILEPFMLRRRVQDVEGSLPPKVSIVLRCRMSAIQSAIYNWIKSTGTIRVDPKDEMRRLQKNPMYHAKTYKDLKNRCIELRKVCNHPLLNYRYLGEHSEDFLVRSCGKLWVLDRILIKLQRTGHRVLLFSTMTKLLDILEDYLEWRKLVYRRIDGMTSLQDRESAILNFNGQDSKCFIFLLSIRAAGRGLNLQSADTVIIYDPDPNPQNEEQAVARAHRIGQTKEVKVIYMEAVVDKSFSFQKQELKKGDAMNSEADLSAKESYTGSIESLMRKNIQQYKIEMTEEVINAGRFDQRTTHEERRMTLETLLHDEERHHVTMHGVPSMQEINHMIARGDEEVQLFNQMDEDFDWAAEMVNYNEVPKWLHATSKEVHDTIVRLSKKPSKNVLSSSIEFKPCDISSCESLKQVGRRKSRPRYTSTHKNPIYREMHDEDSEDSNNSSEEKSGYNEKEVEKIEDEEINDTIDVPLCNKDQQEKEKLVNDDGCYKHPEGKQSSRDYHLIQESGSSGSSFRSHQLSQLAAPFMSSQQLESLSALEATPNSLMTMKGPPDELKEGGVTSSGNSHVSLRKPCSSNQNQDGQTLQPKIKGKCSICPHPENTAEDVEDESSRDKIFSHNDSSKHILVNHGYDVQLGSNELEETAYASSTRHDKNVLINLKGNLPASNLTYNEHPKESQTSETTISGGLNFTASKMLDSIQTKCKNVTSDLQSRIDKEGDQILPHLSAWWRKHEDSCYVSPDDKSSSVLDLHIIAQCVDSLKYKGVMDLITDVQLMLNNFVHYFETSSEVTEVRTEAAKFEDMFFGLMETAFPDVDFREARSKAKFPILEGSETVPSIDLRSNNVSIEKVDADTEPSKTLTSQITSAHDDKGKRNFDSTSRKESEPAVRSGGQKRPEHSNPLARPTEILVSKKRRKDKDKSAIKQRMSHTPSSNSGLLMTSSPSSQGPFSHLPSQSMNNNGAQTLLQKRLSFPGTPAKRPHNDSGEDGSPGLGDIQWTKSGKRRRTDSGKRRPQSHVTQM